MLYFSYKYYSPDYGASDFYAYYKMVLHPLDFSVAPSPLIYRQFSTLITSLIFKMGIFYNMEISYVNEAINQRVFFAFILSNYIALALTALTIMKIIDIEIGKETILSPLFGGVLVFLSFGTLVYVLTGLVEGWTWFFIAFAFYAFKKQNIYLFAVILIVAIFQKEVVSIIFGVISFIFFVLDYLKDRKVNKTYLKFFAISFASFVLYLLLRKVFLPISGYENQLNLQSLIETFLNYSIFTSNKLFTTIFSQNLFFIYILFFVLVFKYRKEEFKTFLALLSAWTLLYMIGMATDLGTNIGRILLVLSPLFAVYISFYSYILENKIKE
jgi:hypothetical protein